MQHIFIKNRVRGEKSHLFFMQQFIEAAIKNGIKSKKDLFHENTLKIKSIFILLLRLIYVPMKHKKGIIITSDGGRTIFKSAFPYYNYDIIPMLWDVWPSTWENLYKDIKKLKCPIVFVTVRYMAQKIRKDLNVNAYWIPEGIDEKLYYKGDTLASREIDVYELVGKRENTIAF